MSDIVDSLRFSSCSLARDHLHWRKVGLVLLCRIHKTTISVVQDTTFYRQYCFYMLNTFKKMECMLSVLWKESFVLLKNFSRADVIYITFSGKNVYLILGEKKRNTFFYFLYCFTLIIMKKSTSKVLTDTTIYFLSSKVTVAQMNLEILLIASCLFFKKRHQTQFPFYSSDSFRDTIRSRECQGRNFLFYAIH